MKALTPGGMRRLKDKAHSETVRVLNVEPMEEEDSSAPVGYISSSFNMPLPDFGRAEDWVDDDDALHNEAKQVYEDLLQGIRKMHRIDGRTRRDALEKLYQYWLPQFDEMAEAFKDWEHNESIGYEMPPVLDGCYSLSVKTINVYGTAIRSVPLPGDVNQSSSMVRAGIFPCSPITHSSGITTRTLQLFHNLFTRCPRLSIQPFVKALCDLHGVPFRPYLMVQLRQAYDAYLEVKRRVRKQVMETLGRGSPDWRITHACVPCQFRLEEDKELDIRMMVACDGNDSLKRDERVDEGADETDMDRLKERKDPREGGGDYFLSEAEVDQWEEENWGEIPNLVEESMEQEHDRLKEWMPTLLEAWAEFRETGLFLLICRHGHVLQMCDMIRSGEKAKYALAVLHAFMSAEKRQREANGEGSPKGGLCVAYDIVCTHSKTIARSPLATLAKWCRYIAALMMMHGYSHERACQLAFMLLYIAGAGLEDLETCERYFSKSNALATVTRHASIFHRLKFIYNNYKQALKILATQDALVTQMKKANLTTPAVFLDWLKEEAEYLQNLSTKPPKETLEMEYYRKLSDLYQATAIRKATKDSWVSYVRLEDGGVDNTRALERLENKLDIRIRWAEGGKEWKAAEDLVSGAKYRRALDKLEGLLVRRMFEMGRLNIAGTGYKLRKHLAKALKTRSQSIRKAIDQYNETAKKMNPPRATVNWDEVVNYSFLSEFDILQDTREDDSRESVQRFRLERGRFNSQHRKRLLSILQLKGFERANEKYFSPGMPVERRRKAQEDEMDTGVPTEKEDEEQEDEQSEDEEVWIDEEEEELFEADALLDLAVDQTV
ncbi:hypothetical protein BT96DRAFT_995705 [Gymnopus androsaceus JB14]|uniref:CxC1-like cysteine cluster associated with KDZ transposases domain-containing protein n=1 Tax=Gymnopus androsaceus JB14 TaxID=1447944 RepID=A0A6A4HHS7_9AGAR|nr:hypothetical protein BT96DRAFT_995705 [Gymnopus androsaceus JB14]